MYKSFFRIFRIFRIFNTFKFLEGNLNCKKMLHELLLSLVGYSGNVIVETREGFLLSPDFPFLHPSERALINKICSLGYYFLQIDSFVQSHSKFSTIEGFYIRAICEGINGILDSYRACVLKAEQQVLADPSTSLSHLLHILYEVFQFLKRKKKKKERKKERKNIY